jgi:hypothetical protein
MAEQTFRSPGYFDTETDLSVRQELGPAGVPASLIGAASRGPAFVPVTVRDFPTFKQTFGDLDTKYPAPYAANEFLKHKTALTFLRVLGAGSLDNSGDILRYQSTGQVRNAGFVVTGSLANGDSTGRHMGAVQFLVARHTLRVAEAYGMPMFTNNSSYQGSTANLVRGVVLLASGARMMVLDSDQTAVGAFGLTTPDDFATVSTNGKFKLVLSSSNGASFGVTDGNSGVKIFTASLNPSSADYFAKLLNTDPEKFASEQHLVYAEFPVDDELATATTVATLSGSANTSTASGDTSMRFRDVFGHFDTKYQTPRTPAFISQPFGATEYDLFHIEARDDGEYANQLYKVSITDLKASTDPSDPYGTFSVLIRAFDDTDSTPNILEQFPLCSLNPTSENYVGKRIGDRKVAFNFESDNLNERRIIAQGRYPNKSAFVRVVVNEQVERKLIPAKALPFGFRGVEVLKTNDDVLDRPQAAGLVRLTGDVGGNTIGSLLSGSIVPPIPFRFKVTKGEVATSGYVGNPGPTELASPSFYWGVKFERNTTALNPNIVSDKNRLIDNLTKFIGIKKLDALVTGTNADTLNNNKFTLARVAFANTSITDLTASIDAHMKEAAYLRNATVNPTTYVVNDGTITQRLTLASLLAATSSVQFNRFSPYAKFTTFLYGGFDGVNILDKSARRFSDKSLSFDAGGGAESSYVSPGLAQNQSGQTTRNNAVVAYKTAIDIMTNPFYVNSNVLAIPGIRESYITNYAAQKTREYGMALYLMDIAAYDDTNTRLYDDSSSRPDVTNTAKSFDSRAIDNNFTAAYFPDIFVDDIVNKRRVKVPATVAALAALAYNDRVAYPWFAPAGFNRAALDFVKNTATRLNSADKDALNDVRINPIANFPKLGFVIFGQKTLQASKSALDRVNVRRLLLEVKRVVSDLALRLVFDNNLPQIREQFARDASARLGIIQTQAGIESFSVVMDETNNTERDKEENRINGRIVIVPTRTIEFINVDFVITNAGVEFTLSS